MFPMAVAVNCWGWLVAANSACFGDKVTLTLGRATVRLKRVVADRTPEAPLMASEVVPVSAPAFTVMVITLVVVATGGLNKADMPDGSPDADRLTLPVKPLGALKVMVLVVLPPWPTTALAVSADSAKPG